MQGWCNQVAFALIHFSNGVEIRSANQVFFCRVLQAYSAPYEPTSFWIRGSNVTTALTWLGGSQPLLVRQILSKRRRGNIAKAGARPFRLPPLPPHRTWPRRQPWSLCSSGRKCKPKKDKVQCRRLAMVILLSKKSYFMFFDKPCSCQKRCCQVHV